MSQTSASRPPPKGYTLVSGPPPVDAYMHLRATSGLSPKTVEQATPAVSNSWAFYHVVHNSSQTVCGMGRIIGDGGWYFHIADMAVLPEHQGKGVGGWILSSLIKEIGDKAPKDAYVSLLADKPGVQLYREHGFRESAPYTVGMTMWL